MSFHFDLDRVQVSNVAHHSMRHQELFDLSRCHRHVARDTIVVKTFEMLDICIQSE